MNEEIQKATKSLMLKLIATMIFFLVVMQLIQTIILVINLFRNTS